MVENLIDGIPTFKKTMIALNSNFKNYPQTILNLFKGFCKTNKFVRISIILRAPRVSSRVIHKQTHLLFTDLQVYLKVLLIPLPALNEM